MAAGLVAIVENFRRAVIAGAGERNLIEIRLLNHLLEAEITLGYFDLAVIENNLLRTDLMLFAQHLDQPLFNDQRGILRRLAVEIRAG
ncbi:hypothetical protein D3C78_1449290 [compost metagenome]